MDSDLDVFGETNYRNKFRKFGIYIIELKQ
jgi:hypothetical protein